MALAEVAAKKTTPPVGRVTFLDVQTEREIGHSSHPRLGFDTLKFTPDGKTLIGGGGIIPPPDEKRGEAVGRVYFWDVATRIPFVAIPTHHWIDVLDITRDGKRFLAGSSQGSVTVWNVESQSRIAGLPRAAGVTGARFSANGELIVMAIVHGDLAIYDLVLQRLVWQTKERLVNYCRLSLRERRLCDSNCPHDA